MVSSHKCNPRCIPYCTGVYIQYLASRYLEALGPFTNQMLVLTWHNVAHHHVAKFRQILNNEQEAIFYSPACLHGKLHVCAIRLFKSSPHLNIGHEFV